MIVFQQYASSTKNENRADCDQIFKCYFLMILYKRTNNVCDLLVQSFISSSGRKYQPSNWERLIGQELKMPNDKTNEAISLNYFFTIFLFDLYYHFGLNRTGVQFIMVLLMQLGILGPVICPMT